MRILMTCDTIGGVWTYALDLAAEFSKHNVAVTLASMGSVPTDEQRAQAAAIPGIDFHASPLKLEWMEEPWTEVEQAGGWLLDLAAQCSPDVIHLNGYAHATLDWNRPVLVVGHSCVLSWWSAVKDDQAPSEWDRYWLTVHEGLQAADCVVAPSEFMLRELRRHYGKLHQARTIYNGRDPSLFCPAAKQPRIFAAGRVWDEAKNLRVLAAAAEGLDWPVRIAGDPLGPDQRPSQFAGVELLGRITPQQVHSEMAAAEIFAHPSLYEPFGLSVLEAAFSGCALVLADTPSLREVWGDAAVFVNPRDVPNWHRALVRLIGNEPQRGVMARKALARARHFTASRMGRAYFGLYRRLIAGIRAPAVVPLQAPAAE